MARTTAVIQQQSDSISATMTTVTPAMAAELMKVSAGAVMAGGKCRRQRALKSSKVKRFLRAMKFGHWKTTHQGVAIDTRGVVIDGQNRLAAIIESGASVRMFVFRDLDPETFSVIDTGGMERTVADMVVCKSRDVNGKAANRIAAIAKPMLLGCARVDKPDRDEVSDHAVDHAPTIMALDRALGPMDGLSLNPAIVAAFVNASLVYGQARVDECAGIWRREDGDPKSPVRLCKSHVREQRNKGAKVTSRGLYRQTCYALKAAIDGRAITKVVEDLEDFGAAGVGQ